MPILIFNANTMLIAAHTSPKVANVIDHSNTGHYFVSTNLQRLFRRTINQGIFTQYPPNNIHCFKSFSRIPALQSVKKQWGMIIILTHYNSGRQDNASLN